MSSADQPGALTSTPEFRLMGTRSVLIELPDTATVMAWHAHLSAHPLDAQIEVIAAAREAAIHVLSNPVIEDVVNVHELTADEPEQAPITGAGA